MTQPDLYHGSTRRIEGVLQPVLVHQTEDYTHERAALFGTERADIAALFMFPLEVLASIGFEQDIAYICIWGTPEAYVPQDRPGYLYVLPGDTFEKIGKAYEWQSFEAVIPRTVEEYASALEGMLSLGVQVYFINDDALFDRIVADKDNRAPILRDLVSENERRGLPVRRFA